MFLGFFINEILYIKVKIINYIDILKINEVWDVKTRDSIKKVKLSEKLMF